VLNRALAADLGFMQAVLQGIFTVPGDGCIPFLPLLQDLQAHNYAGWLVVEAEQDPRIAHPLTFAKLGYRNLLATAQQAGFTVTESQL
jgi:inosose dehydratase